MDLNGDGSADILSGSYSRMEQPMAGLFQVLWGKKGGGFKKAETLRGTDGEPLIIPIKGKDDQTENICTRPFAVDWIGQGKLDLIVGTFSGTFYRFLGEGKGKFAPKPEQLLADGQPLRISGAHSDPFVVDWDGDGDLDILSGSSEGGVQWAENIAGKGTSPKLKGFQSLIERGPSYETGKLLRVDDLTGPTTSTRIWVADMNGDAKLDILVGDSVTLVSTANGVSEEEYAKRYKKWRAEYDKALTAMHKGGSAEGPRERFREVYDKRKEFMTEERTGFVWVYHRKD